MVTCSFSHISDRVFAQIIKIYELKLVKLALKVRYLSLLFACSFNLVNLLRCSRVHVASTLWIHKVIRP